MIKNRAVNVKRTLLLKLGCTEHGLGASGRMVQFSILETYGKKDNCQDFFFKPKKTGKNSPNSQNVFNWLHKFPFLEEQSTVVSGQWHEFMDF